MSRNGSFSPHASNKLTCLRTRPIGLSVARLRSCASEEKIMSREQKVAVVEAYLDCFATKDLSKVSFAEDVTFEGPRMPKLAGRATILGFLTQIFPVVRGIQLKQHIVEGDYVAT